MHGSFQFETLHAASASAAQPAAFNARVARLALSHTNRGELTPCAAEPDAALLPPTSVRATRRVIIGVAVRYIERLSAPAEGKCAAMPCTRACRRSNLDCHRHARAATPSCTRSRPRHTPLSAASHDRLSPQPLTTDSVTPRARASRRWSFVVDAQINNARDGGVTVVAHRWEVLTAAQAAAGERTLIAGRGLGPAHLAERTMALPAGEANRVQTLLETTAPTANAYGHYVVRLDGSDEEFEVAVGEVGISVDETPVPRYVARAL
jgi:hypothetical protein